MTVADYTDPVTGQSYIRGHNIDFADTINTPGTLSTMDPVNYTPEQADWGCTCGASWSATSAPPAAPRDNTVRWNSSSPTPCRATANGRRIPDGVYFAEYNSHRRAGAGVAGPVGRRGGPAHAGRQQPLPDSPRPAAPILRWGPASPAVATGGSVSAAAARSDEAPR
jgi:hypothetical protein